MDERIRAENKSWGWWIASKLWDHRYLFLKMNIKERKMNMGNFRVIETQIDNKWYFLKRLECAFLYDYKFNMSSSLKWLLRIKTLGMVEML